MPKAEIFTIVIEPGFYTCDCNHRPRRAASYYTVTNIAIMHWKRHYAVKEDCVIIDKRV